MKFPINLLVGFILCFPFYGISQWSSHEIQQVIKEYTDSHHIPGVMVTVVKSDTIIWSGGIGYAELTKQEKVTDQHLFRLGSISKSITALGLLHALNDSDYTIDTPIKRIDSSIPFQNPWKDNSPVLVSHVLEHTSGFDDFYLHAMYNDRDDQLPPIKNMLADHKQSLISRWRPGTKKAYSNPNYIVAGHLIEVLTGMPFNQYIKKNILLPIGLSSSDFYFSPPKEQLLVQGYQRNGTDLHPITFAKINGSPAGDFCSSAKEMGKFLQFLLNRDTTIFSIKDFERIEKPQTSFAAKGGLDFGYGLGNYSVWKNGYVFHGHGGDIDGFSSRYLYSREADLGLAVAMNRNGNANELIGELLTALLGAELIASSDRNHHTIPDSIITEYTGFYEFSSPKNELLSFAERLFGGYIADIQNDMIVRRRLFGRPKDTLYYAGNEQLYFDKEDVTSILLGKSESQKPVIWINDGYSEKSSRTRRLSIVFGLLLSILSVGLFFVYSLFWLLTNVFRKIRKNSTNHLVFLGIGSSLVFIFLGFGLSVSHPKTAMYISFSSILMYISSFALLIFTALAFYRWFTLPKKIAFSLCYITASLGALYLSIYLYDIGFIGLRLWSY